MCRMNHTFSLKFFECTGIVCIGMGAVLTFDDSEVFGADANAETFSFQTDSGV